MQESLKDALTSDEDNIVLQVGVCWERGRKGGWWWRVCTEVVERGKSWGYHVACRGAHGLPICIPSTVSTTPCCAPLHATQNHMYGLPPPMYEKYPALAKWYNIVSTSKVRQKLVG